jgi:predicted amidohydrolase
MSNSAPNLRVSLVQTDLIWDSPSSNCGHLEEQLVHLVGQTDLVILPEMFSTGFSMSANHAEIPQGPSTQWMLMQAKRIDAVIVGSLKIKEKFGLVNRLIVAFPDGSMHSYDKKHLFRMGNEHEFYQPGEKKLVFTYKGWRISPYICYDLRFPVWSRNVDLAYDLAIYVANWPAARTHAWDVLLKARAIENLAYVAGVNRVGTDGNALEYAGHSAIISFKGEALVHLGMTETIQNCSLSLTDLQTFRTNFPAHLDADSFQLI